MPNHTVPSTDSTQRLINAVRSLWEELHPGQHRSVALNSALERDLGFDSLARVELIARIEKSYDAKLPDEIFAQAETVQDLLQAVLAASTAATKSRSAIAPSPALPLPVARYPESAQTLVDVLDWHLRVHPDRMHVVFYATPDQVQSLPYGQLRSDTQQLAAGLDEHRLMPGQAVGIMLPTSLDFFRVFFGVLLAGGVPVPLYPPARRAQIEDHLRRQGKILANAAATLLITVPEVRLVSTYLLSNIRAWSRAADLTSEDVCVSWLPLYHDMGLIGTWLGTLYNSGLLVLMSPLSFLARPERWLWAIHKHRGTVTAAPNFAFELCNQRIEDGDIAGLDLSSCRLAANGAEPVSPDTIERFTQRFSKYGLRPQAMVPVYGLAESSVGLTVPPSRKDTSYRSSQSRHVCADRTCATRRPRGY